MVVHAFNSNTQNAETGELCEFEVNYTHREFQAI